MLGIDRNIETIKDALYFIQARRRYFVSILYLIPTICTGTIVAQDDMLQRFLPLVEINCMSIVSCFRQSVLFDIFDDFKLMRAGDVFKGNYDIQPLESYSLEPQRLSIVDIAEFRPSLVQFSGDGMIDTSKVISIEEFRNSLKNIEDAYTPFGLDKTPFAMARELVCSFLDNCYDDYFISIDKAAFEKKLVEYGGTEASNLVKLLVYPGGDFLVGINATHPFVLVDGKIESNLFLLMRFLYNYKDVCLAKSKKFQIQAGFIFEDSVKQVLRDIGFDIVGGVKRINRKEFDVVSVKDNVVYNFQCKNNFIDISKLAANPKLYVRYNKNLVSYYRKALDKEKEREGLLLGKLGLSIIEHYIVSRFPVTTKDKNIISFNGLHRLVV